MTKLPQRLDGESPERSAIRAVRAPGWVVAVAA